ncbi:hypothetical protein LCGC14_0744140 [marine sediment metagenome]|uniref:ASCH domain-containing protein n=1 Tax=marine sediment metagenome TaxID=412755 RepID=A0A0F9Q5X3_9ZZZZ
MEKMKSYGIVSFSGDTKAGPFYEQIHSGRKTLTLRKRRKDGRAHVKPGYSFPMYWMVRKKKEEKPIHYIGRAECVAYESVKIVDRWHDTEFAKSDGFEDLDEFRDNWFPGWREFRWLDEILEAYYSLKEQKVATLTIVNWGRRYGKNTIVAFLELEYMKIGWKHPLIDVGSKEKDAGVWRSERR